MNKPVKVLMVVMDFYQAGAPRFAYEVDRALNKSVFDISILSVKNLNASEQFNDYYYSKHKELGSKIYFVNGIMKTDGFFNYSIEKIVFNKILSRISGKKLNYRFLSFLNNKKKEKFLNFVVQFDVISWMGEYTFSHFINYFDDAVYNKSVIHLMAAKFQNVHVFNQYPKNKRYTITSGFDDERQIRYELSDLQSYDHTFLPLAIEIKEKNNNWKFKKNKTINKIGIFTRLDFMKPLDTFFAAFHLLLDQLPKSELHVFGAGDPGKTGMQRLANNFSIEDKVFFKGHQKDIVQTAIKEELDLVWFHGYKNRPAGYAGFDICSTGIPQLFWDFSETKHDPEYGNICYPQFKSLNQFIQKSIQLLTYEQQAHVLSKLQFEDLAKNRNSYLHIQRLEELYMRTSKQT